MDQYKSLVKELHRGVQQQRMVWQHKIGGRYLKQVENLRAQAQRHCQEQGVSYDSLLLSEVLQACEVYLREKALKAPASPTVIGLYWIKFPPDVELAGLLGMAQRVDFFCDQRGC
ncbi:hypothetical protein POKO110462_13180 [Pontibacter korlensis]|uniref:Uncharacterized protein n=1 Tax=Pontibacter korlensis TaxID=400092 RepID=A0A0E3ZH93_9BACT|nr:hypothetical protein [Pontibacter korlensis]AKD04319.1 hypothetical protein PKOR_16005 [Pontibacter korlensis]